MPKVQECIDYICGCGFKLIGRQRNYYVFRKLNGLMPNGGSEVSFSLSELRHAKVHGW